MRRLVALGLSTLMVWGCGELPHESPFDPGSPAEKLAKGEVTGTVRLAGETDFAGITVELQSEARTYNVQTDAQGAFRIAGVVPGDYDVRLETRYFVAERSTITVPLGDGYEISPVTLEARTAKVTGSALVQKSDVESSGGVTITLHKTGSIRGGAAAAPGAWRTQAQGADPETESEEDGSFSLDDVPAGVYEVNASTPETGDETMGEITVTGEEESVEVEPIVVRPVSGFFSIDNVGGFVTSPVVTLRLSGFNAESMRLGFSPDGSPDACGFTVTKGYQALDTITLSQEGETNVCVAFEDAQGRSTEPLVESVFFDATPPTVFDVTLDDGTAFSRDLSVRLAIQAADVLSGIASMQLAFTTNVTAATPLDFTPLSNLALPSGDGTKSLYLRLVDRAGNASPVVVRSIAVDSALNAAVSASLEDDLGRTAATDRQFVALRLQGLTADVAEMIAASNNSFAGAIWTPVTDAVAWQLASGDGLKTVFVKVRDLAGNESGVLQASITLDQSGPDTPGISLFDTDGDGAALSNTAVELLWGIPGAADLAGFELQRYVQGVDLGFQTLALLSPGVDRYVDDVTATTGHAHHYRIRAYDALGNSSGWSVVVDAHPFEPVQEAYWIRTETGLRYVFNPFPGTYSLRAAYQYDDYDGLTQTQELNSDVAYWDRVTTGGVVLNEQLAIKTVNSDNTLAFQSLVPLKLETRRRVAAGGRFVAMTQATDGTMHMLMNGGVTNASGFSYVHMGSDGAEQAAFHYQFEATFIPRGGAIVLRPNGTPVGAVASVDATASTFRLFAMRNFGAAATYEVIATIASPNVTNMGPAVAADDGALHIFWADGPSLYYANDVTGVWSKSLLGTGAGPAAARDANGKLHVCYHSGTTLYYINNASGAWSTPFVVAAGARYCAIIIKPDGLPFIAYAASAGSDLYLANFNGASWSTALVFNDPSGTTGFYPGLFTDTSGIHLAWDPGGYADLKYITNKTGGWVARSIDAGSPISGRAVLAVDPEGTLHVLYYHTVGTEARYARLAKNQSTKTQITGFADSIDWKPYANGTEVWALSSEWDGVSDYNLYLAKRNADGSWSKELVALSAGMYGSTLAFDNAGNPLVAWYHPVDFDVMYATKSGGIWNVETVDSAGDVGYNARLFVDPQNHPVIVYTDVTNAAIKIARHDGAGWQFTSLAGGYYEFNDAAMDTAGNLHLTASKNSLGDVWYVTDKYAGWTTEQVDTSGAQKSLAVGTDGAVHIAYFRWQPDYDLGYATNESGTWRRAIVDAPGDTGFYPEMLLDARNTPHILYRDDSNQRLCYAVRVNGGWSTGRLTQYTGTFGGYFEGDDDMVAFYYDTGGVLTELRDFQGRLPATAINVVSPW